MGKMTRRLVAALVAVLAFATLAEAAPGRSVRHRARHSTRVSAGASTSATTKKKPARPRVRARKSTTTPAQAPERTQHTPPTKPQ